ncbi:MAG: 7-cyano-7-deazaguanine synthase QueC, partial [Thermodesulfobacteriota bacterium]
MKNAVILFSGGLDSSTCLAIAKSQGFNAYALSFRYGQRHEVELDAARRVAKHLGAAGHLVMDVPLGNIGGSALTAAIDVPKDRDVSRMEEEIPVTYVPARNTVFLSLALAWAEVLPAADIFIGVNALDYSGYPDCRPEFVAAFENMANLAIKEAVEGRLKIKIHAPLMRWDKARIIQEGM